MTIPWLRNAVLALCLLSATAAVWETLRRKETQWDLNAYCGSIRAMQEGLDPYYIENVRRFSGNDLIIAYPVATLLFISPACVVPRVTFPVMTALLLVLVGALVRRMWPEDPALLGVILLGGFAATHWNLATGNLGVLELAAFAAAIVSLHRGGYVASGLWMGLIAAAKLTPIVLAALLAAVVLRHHGWRPLLRFAVGSALGFAALHGLSAMMSLRYEYSMVQVLLGRIPEPGKFTPMREWHGDWSNPSLLLVIKDVVKAMGLPRGVAVVIVALQLAGSAFILARLWRRDRDPWTLLSYGVLLTCLLLPRFKPYYFVYPLIPLYYLLRNRELRLQVTVLMVGVVLPVLAYANPLERYVTNAAFKIPLSASQVVFLLATVLILVWTDRHRWLGPTPWTDRRELQRDP